MKITAEMIKKSVAGVPFGDERPFIDREGAEYEIRTYHQNVIASLERSRQIKVYRGLDSYGSGYASYIHLFLYKNHGHSTYDRGEYFETVGLYLYLSRLAPIGVYGPGFRTENKKNKGSSGGFLEKTDLYNLPNGDWASFLQEAIEILEDSGIVFLPQESLIAPLPFEIEIPTNIDPPFAIFDALFYWED